ncbi:MULTISPECIES: hypothetical protein [unclassified Serratia (in: enterobacteria)]|uniref:hypothetical protein n=1 Tax=unclassified Serratia (in: enterobacteria) TaxID=2647522 RepID=UPI0030767CC3
MKIKLNGVINGMLKIVTIILFTFAVGIILIAINSHNEINMMHFIIPFLGGCVGSFITSFLKKTAEINAIRHQFEEVKRQLAITTKITEDIKGEIGRGNISYQIKLSELTQRKTKAISEIYTSLYKATCFIKENRADEGDNQERFKNIVADFWSCFSESNIWLPKELSVEVADYFNMVSHKYKEHFQNAMQRREIFCRTSNDDPETQRRIEEEALNISRNDEEFRNFIMNGSNQILSRIESKFREITEIA